MEMDQATTVSRLRDGIQSAEASASDFDPFAGWDLSLTRCYWFSASCTLYISIYCMQKWPDAFYRIAVGDQERIPSVIWPRSTSRGFLVALVINCGLMIRSPSSLAVSVVHHSDQVPKKKLPLGTLNYDTTTKDWTFVPRPQPVSPKSPQPTNANAEAIGDEVTSVGKSPSALSGNNHQAEQSSSYDEIVNNPTQPVNEAISQSTSITNSNSVSNPKILVSLCFMQGEYMDLLVVLDYLGGNIPNLLTSVLFFDFTELASEFLADRGSTMVQAKCSPSPVNRRYEYGIRLTSSISEWYWLRPVAVHLHFGSADPKLFVGTRRYNLEGRLVWHHASPGEACSCSSCV
jgi:hypothetical protein